MSIGGHQSAKMGKNEWLTPPEIIRALGVFDLDPCAPVAPPWATAKSQYSIKENGLMRPWFGRVWLNPPYGATLHFWLRTLAHHGNGIAITFARTETAAFFSEVWPKADGILFIKGRLHFYHVDGTRAKGNSGAPSVLIAYGQENADALKNSGIPGAFIQLKERNK